MPVAHAIRRQMAHMLDSRRDMYCTMTGHPSFFRTAAVICRTVNEVYQFLYIIRVIISDLII